MSEASDRDGFDEDSPTFAGEDTNIRDRRSQERIGASFKVRYETIDEFVDAYTTDISRGGLFLAGEELLPEGTVVRLAIELPAQGPTLAIIARVAHVTDEPERRGMGMEFLDVSPEKLAEQVAGYLTDALGAEAPRVAEPPAQVLIVDDDAIACDRAALVMRKRGHRVELASNGLEALAHVLRDPPDLILCDVEMPTMDGWKLLRLIRARPSVAHIPVIFLTSLDSEAERLQGYQLGVDDYIAKPFLFEELALRVGRVLERSRARPGNAASRNALRGDLAQVPLPSVLQFVDIEKRTGVLLVVSEQRIATIHVRDGRVIAVDAQGDKSGTTGLDLLYQVLDWNTGRFELTCAEVKGEDTIDCTTSFILLEHARMQDEKSR